MYVKIEQIINKLNADEWDGTNDHAHKILIKTVGGFACVRKYNEASETLQALYNGYNGCALITRKDKQDATSTTI